MKSYLKIGEYGRYDNKQFRCVEDGHSQMKRCILCELRKYGLCKVMQCQPDEREDGKAVVFLQVRPDRKIVVGSRWPVVSGQ